MVLMHLYFFKWETIKNAWKQPFTKIAYLLFFCSAISVLWSTNIQAWEKDTVTKLLLIVLPLALQAIVLNKGTFVKIVTYAINAFILATVINSMLIYFQNPSLAQDQYMLTTTKYGDHIRFSFLIALHILLNFYLVFEYWKKLNKLELLYILLSIIVPFAYLHLLSARTGLLCGYAGIGLILFIKAWQYKKAMALAVVVGISLIPFAAIQLSPRLYDKVHYMIWEATQVKDQDPSVQFNYSDNNRVLSYNAAMHLIKDNKLIGVGAGDLRDEMRGAYAELYPSIPKEGRLEVPHMQFLSTATAIGLPAGLICILGLIVTPFFSRYKRKLYIGINMTLMLLFFMVDANLEIQFGLLIFLFYTLLWMIIERSDVKDLSEA